MTLDPIKLKLEACDPRRSNGNKPLLFKAGGDYVNSVKSLRGH
jgi:hypothetical protein